ncbi:hypothetical protein CEXT_529841 [Caerostris extrusa]|uniref:Uncharacterized protein n=1 Tax=Caerostris extrusa TaxID=172846 RepID=A0AAV4QAZ9_CAEEX|nr:hypothetical protein CEXT_529841 [Caerostris extrusa]
MILVSCINCANGCNTRPHRDATFILTTKSGNGVALTYSQFKFNRICVGLNGDATHLTIPCRESDLQTAIHLQTPHFVTAGTYGNLIHGMENRCKALHFGRGHSLYLIDFPVYL